MNPKVQEFIEYYLDIIDQDDWMQIFLIGYDELNNTQTRVFLTMMKDAGLDYSKIITYRDAALIFIITHQMEDLSPGIWRPNKFTELLGNNFLGLSYSQMLAFIFDNASEWPDNIVIRDYDFYPDGKFEIEVLE